MTNRLSTPRKSMMFSSLKWKLRITNKCQPGVWKHVQHVVLGLSSVNHIRGPKCLSLFPILLPSRLNLREWVASYFLWTLYGRLLIHLCPNSTLNALFLQKHPKFTQREKFKPPQKTKNNAGDSLRKLGCFLIHPCSKSTLNAQFLPKHPKFNQQTEFQALQKTKNPANPKK